MSSLAILAVLLATAVVVFLIGRVKAEKTASSASAKLHSRPSYHGSYLAILTVLPVILLLALWGAAEGPALRYLLLRDMPASVQELPEAERSLTLSVVNSIARRPAEAQPRRIRRHSQGALRLRHHRGSPGDSGAARRRARLGARALYAGCRRRPGIQSSGSAGSRSPACASWWPWPVSCGPTGASRRSSAPAISSKA